VRRSIPYRALIVEDEPAWQQIVAEILIESGLEVDVANDVDSAIAVLRQAPHRLAVVDLALGEGMAANKDGLQVLEAVRRQDPGCKTILLTGYATVELAVRVLTEYGVLSCLQKANFDRGEFRNLVSQALAIAPVHSAAADHGSMTGPLPTGSVTVRSESSATRGRVLVVDDDAGWRQILSELLSDAGYQVRACSSYGEAAGYLRRETYRLAVVDLSLGDARWPQGTVQEPNGYLVLQLAHDLGAATVVVSGVASTGDIAQAYEDYGAFSYVQKQSFDRHAFLRAVAEACAACESEQDLSALTARETEVLTLLAQGKTNKDIADALVISGNTVKRHLKAIFDKLGVHTRAAAAAKAISAGLSGGPSLS
jgi:DNA-binding NarL/FixJ family response regulator